MEWSHGFSPRNILNRLIFRDSKCRFLINRFLIKTCRQLSKVLWTTTPRENYQPNHLKISQSNLEFQFPIICAKVSLRRCRPGGASLLNLLIYISSSQKRIIIQVGGSGSACAPLCKKYVEKKRADLVKTKMHQNCQH